MFEATRSRGPALWLVPLGFVAAGGAVWVLASAEPEPEPVAAPIAAAEPPGPARTLEEGRERLNAALATLGGAELFHIDCAPPACVATVRMPLPKGADAAWRDRLERHLRAEGWTLAPPGRVQVLDARQVDHGFLPDRALYTVSFAPGPLPEEDLEPLRARIREQAGDGVFAFGPW